MISVSVPVVFFLFPEIQDIFLDQDVFKKFSTLILRILFLVPKETMNIFHWNALNLPRHVEWRVL